jgi:hypothetical protein
VGGGGPTAATPIGAGAWGGAAAAGAGADGDGSETAGGGAAGGSAPGVGRSSTTEGVGPPGAGDAPALVRGGRGCTGRGAGIPEDWGETCEATGASFLVSRRKTS